MIGTSDYTSCCTHLPGVLPKKIEWGLRHTSQNPYLTLTLFMTKICDRYSLPTITIFIYDPDQKFGKPYSWSDPQNPVSDLRYNKFFLVQTNVKLP